MHCYGKQTRLCLKNPTTHYRCSHNCVATHTRGYIIVSTTPDCTAPPPGFTRVDISPIKLPTPTHSLRSNINRRVYNTGCVRGTIDGHQIAYPGAAAAYSITREDLSALKRCCVRGCVVLYFRHGDYYLRTPLNRPEYMRISLKQKKR